MDKKFGDPGLLQQARDLCAAIERLPAGDHQTRLVAKVADATFALQELQRTGEFFWPRRAPIDRYTILRMYAALPIADVEGVGEARFENIMRCVERYHGIGA